MPRDSKFRFGKEGYRFESPDSKGNKSRITMLMGVLVVLVIIGAALLTLLVIPRLFPPPAPPDQNITTPDNDSAGALPAICGDACLFMRALNTSSPSTCKEIANDSMKNDCYIVLSNDSLDACIQVQTMPALKDCIFKFAVEMKNSDLCLYVTEPDATRCMALLDPCYMKNETEKLICLALTRKNYSYCGWNRDCIFNYSQTTGNTDPCRLFPDEVEVRACMSVGLKKDKCYDLNLRSQKDLCYQLYAIRSNDNLVCSQITSDSMYMMNCLSYFAIKLNKYSVCDQDGLKFNNRWQCYTNYSMVTGDVSGCVAIDKLATTARFACIYDYAKLYGNPAACELTNDTGFSVTCYVGSIMNNTHLNYRNCKNISPITWRNKCYTQSAKLANDATLCDFIEGINEKKSCVSTVGK